MPDTPTLNPQILGKAESAHRALLDRVLDGTGITYHQWVALNLTLGADAIERDQLMGRMSGALKIGDASALTAMVDLIAAGLLEEQPGDSAGIRITDDGRKLHSAIRSKVGEIVARLYRDIPADDLATAGRVLVAVTAAADVELGTPPTTTSFRPSRP